MLNADRGAWVLQAFLSLFLRAGAEDHVSWQWGTPGFSQVAGLHMVWELLLLERHPNQMPGSGTVQGREWGVSV